MTRSAIIALCLLAIPTGAHAQGLRQPARLDLQPLFGEGTLVGDGWVPVLVEVENRTRADQRGALALEVGDYRGTTMRRHVPLHVPAGQTRLVQVPVFTGAPGAVVTSRFEAGGRVLGRAQRSVDYAPSDRSVVIFSDPPRLRGSLLDLDVEIVDPVNGARQVRFPVGTVRFDPATADPILPERATGWSTVKLLVASGPALARVSAPQRAAIEDWLRTGGVLLVFPRSEADARLPWLASLAGEIASDGEPWPVSGWVPPEAFRFRCVGAAHYPAGCARGVGRGQVYVAAYDGESPLAIESGVTRAFVSSLLASDVGQAPALRYGRGTDELDQRYWSETGSFGSLRAALDPNQAFRPALVLVAFVLLFYVILVGPLNFRWIGARNRPTLALVTTPLAATSCVLVLLAVGYLGKGITMRHRRLEVVEALEGETRAPARRYTGLFSTRPGTFELPIEAGAETLRIGGGSGQGPLHRTEGGRELLGDFRAGLWETTFLREDRMRDLGGAIRFERGGEQLTFVINESGEALEGAFVVDEGGAIYEVGDVLPGTRAPIPSRAVRSLASWMLLGPDSDAPRAIAASSGLDPGDSDERARLRGLVHLLGNQFVPRGAPVLYARMPAGRETLGGVFAAEVDQVWLRLSPRLDGAYVPPPTLEEGVTLEEPLLEAGDAGEPAPADGGAP